MVGRHRPPAESREGWHPSVPLNATHIIDAPNLAASWAIAYGRDGEIIVLARDAAARRELSLIAVDIAAGTGEAEAS